MADHATAGTLFIFLHQAIELEIFILVKFLHEFMLFFECKQWWDTTGLHQFARTCC